MREGPRGQGFRLAIIDDKKQGEKGPAESTDVGLSHAEIILLMSYSGTGWVLKVNKAPTHLESAREDERTKRKLPQMKDNSKVPAVNGVIILLVDSTLQLTQSHVLPQKVSSSTNSNWCFQPLPDPDQYFQCSQEHQFPLMRYDSTTGHASRSYYSNALSPKGSQGMSEKAAKIFHQQLKIFKPNIKCFLHPDISIFHKVFLHWLRHLLYL